MVRAQTVVLGRFDDDSVRRARFKELVVNQRDRAFSTAWRLLGGDGAAADDVVQEAFLRTYRSLPNFRGASKLETWFFRILIRQILNYRRWRKLKKLWPLSDVEELVDSKRIDGGDPGLRRRISEALERLTERQRSVFVLVHLEGFAVTETAVILECSVGTVKSHLHRALKKLRTDLADLQNDGVATEAI